MRHFELTDQMKKKLLWLIPFALLIIMYFSGLLMQVIVSLLTFGWRTKAVVTFNPLTAWYITIAYQPGRVVFLLLSALLLLAVVFSRWRENVLNLVSYTDERGVGFARQGTYGIAQPLQERDLEKAKDDFEVGPVEKINGYILGRLDMDKPGMDITSRPGKRTIAVKRQRLGNYNILVCGGSGSGKSAGYVRANILQAIKAGESVVVTDPVGELYTTFYKTFCDKGIDCKAFNLASPEFSDSWACLDEILNPLTEEADEERVTDFATIIIDNTGGVSKDQVYSQGQHNLLKAIIHHLAWDVKMKTAREYGLLLEELVMQESLPLSSAWINWARRSLSPNCTSTTKQKTEIIQKALRASTLDDETKRRFWSSHTDKIPELSLSTIYYLLATHDKDSMGTLFTSMPNNNPGKIAYHYFENQNEKLKDSFIGGLGTRLQLWQSRAIRRITRNKDIVLTDAGDHQVAYFVIIPDQSTSTRAISSLFFNFLFKDNADMSDLVGGKNRVRINFIMDEFANIGMIPDIEQKINIARGRNLSLSIILQDIKQLDNVYGRDTAPVIIGGCNTVLFLGSDNPDTCEFFSALSGEATISVKTVRNARGVGRVEPLAKEYQESAGEGKRYVYTEHEVRTLPNDECLIWVSGHNVLRARKFWWFTHPMSKEKGKPLPESPPSTHIPAVVKYQDTERRDAFFDRSVINFEFEEPPEEVEKQAPKAAVKLPQPPEAKKQTKPAGKPPFTPLPQKAPPQKVVEKPKQRPATIIQRPTQQEKTVKPETVPPKAPPQVALQPHQEPTHEVRQMPPPQKRQESVILEQPQETPSPIIAKAPKPINVGVAAGLTGPKRKRRNSLQAPLTDKKEIGSQAKQGLHTLESQMDED